MKATTAIRESFTMLLLAAIGLQPAAAQHEVVAMCFLEGIEPEMEDNLMSHQVEVEVRCAAADRRVVDVAGFDLRLLDGDADLVAAGVAWKEEHLKTNPEDDFLSSEPTNAIAVSETGRERSVQLRAHTHALPTSGVVRLEGSVELVVEADCVGEDARQTVSVKATAGALRQGAAIPVPGGGEIAATDQGVSNQDPMLGIAGDGSYFGLSEPPAGVREMVFFGKKRIVVGVDVPADTAVTVEVCPTETIRVPVAIEAAI